MASTVTSGKSLHAFSLCLKSLMIALLALHISHRTQLTIKYEGWALWLHSGRGCQTSALKPHIQWTHPLELDRAMLATGDFQFEEPVASNSEWDCVLDLYETTQEWPDIELPNKDASRHLVAHKGLSAWT